MFAWFKALWHLSDDKMYEICGTDNTLYLVFLRMTSILLFIITVFNSLVMVPIYVTGDPMASDDYQLVDSVSKMSAATVLNITGSPSKMTFAYMVAILFIPTLAAFMVYKFRAKYYSWKQEINPLKPFTDLDMAKFTIEVRNLPIDEGVESLQRRIHTNMLKLYPPDPIYGKSAFVRARVIGDYNALYKKCVELKKLMDELAFVKKKNIEMGGVERR